MKIVPYLSMRGWRLIFLAALLVGCQTPQQRQAEEKLAREMAEVKQKVDRKEAERQEALRRRLEEYETRKNSKATVSRTSEQPPSPQAPPAENPVKKESAEDKPPAHSDARKGWQKDLARDLKNYPANLKEDLAGFVDKDNLLENSIAIGAGLSLAIVSKSTSWDKNVRRSFPHRNQRFGAATNVADVVGNPGVHFGVAGLAYAYGEAYKDYQAAEAGRRLFEALAINDLLTVGLQLATNQKRPNGERMAFPSGHTSSMFALAAVLDGVYGPLVGVPMYGLAGFVGVARLDDRKHNLSDVLLGAALGYVVGRTVTKTHQKKTMLGFEVDPWVEEESGAGGVQLRKRF